MLQNKNYCKLLIMLCFLSSFMGVLFVCSPPGISGTGTNIGNAIVVGYLVNESGTPATNTNVYLIPLDFNPLSFDTIPQEYCTSTDSTGRYEFVGLTLKSKNFSIHAINQISQSQVIKQSIVLVDSALNRIDSMRLSDPGSVQIKVTDKIDTAKMHVFIPGVYGSVRISENIIHVGTEYHITMKQVPAATFSMIYIGSELQPQKLVSLIDSEFVVKSAETVTVISKITQFIKGRTVDTSGNALSGVAVYLLPVSHDPLTQQLPDVLKTISDSTGEYVFEITQELEKYIDENNVYGISYVNQTPSLAGFIEHAIVTKTCSGKFCGFNSIEIKDLVMCTAGSLKILLPDSLAFDAIEFGIRGTLVSTIPRTSIIRNSYYDHNEILLGAIPAGAYKKEHILQSSTLNSISLGIGDSLCIHQGDTTVIGYYNRGMRISQKNNASFSDKLLAAAVDSRNYKWFGSFDGYLFKLMQLDTTQRGKQVFVVQKAPNGLPIYSICPLPDNTLICGVNSGLGRFINETRWEPLVGSFAANSQDHVNALLLDKYGSMWFGKTRIGVGVFTENVPMPYYFNTDNSLLPNNNVSGLAVDAENRIWISTRLGVARYNGDMHEWKVYSKTKSQIFDSDVLSISVDSNNDVWCGLNNGSVVCIHPNDMMVVYNAQNSELPGSGVNKIVCCRDRSVWFGHVDGTVTVFKNGDPANLFVFNSKNSKIPEKAGKIVDMSLDSDNALWIVTEKSGVVVFKVREDLFISQD